TAVLSEQQIGSITVDFRSDVDQGRFRKTQFFVEDEDRTSDIVELKPGKSYKVRIVPPPPWPEVKTNLTFRAEPLNQSYPYSPGYGPLALAYPDVDIRTAAVWLNDGDKLGIVANEIFRLPEGRYSVVLELNGYTTTNFPVHIRNGQTNSVTV